MNYTGKPVKIYEKLSRAQSSITTKEASTSELRLTYTQEMFQKSSPRVANTNMCPRSEEHTSELQSR